MCHLCFNMPLWNLAFFVVTTNTDEYGVYVKTTFEIIHSHNDKIALIVKNNTVWKWVWYKTEWMFGMNRNGGYNREDLQKKNRSVHHSEHQY